MTKKPLGWMGWAGDVPEGIATFMQKTGRTSKAGIRCKFLYTKNKVKVYEIGPYTEAESEAVKAKPQKGHRK